MIRSDVYSKSMSHWDNCHARFATENVVVNYTVNGVSSSVTFTEVGIKTIPVSFINGENVIALVETGQSLSFTIIPEPSFELVP